MIKLLITAGSMSTKSVEKIVRIVLAGHIISAIPQLAVLAHLTRNSPLKTVMPWKIFYFEIDRIRIKFGRGILFSGAYYTLDAERGIQWP
jgi:hypothetical protein